MHNMSRRKFIKTALGASVVAPSVILSGCSGSGTVDRGLNFSSFSEAMAEAGRLAGKSLVLPPEVFSLSQVLTHCAQSIEYSMTGFPESKSVLFQSTLGSAAFSVFSWKGHMSHDLTEGIPGAPSLESNTDTDLALSRLSGSIAAFATSNEVLKPHFAYGQLSKDDYESAHILHLANHFSSIDA